MGRYAVRFDDGHDKLVEAPDAITAAKDAKRVYDGGQHRVLRVLLGSSAALARSGTQTSSGR
jgi:hypothetical protein